MFEKGIIEKNCRVLKSMLHRLQSFLEPDESFCTCRIFDVLAKSACIRPLIHTLRACAVYEQPTLLKKKCIYLTKVNQPKRKKKFGQISSDLFGETIFTFIKISMSIKMNTAQ